ncbi:MAG: hypothetical protein L0216_19515 [Planctomycetales bacterium]|nr:hypothetical protein [Planctomycetales bacterium]
MAAPFGRLLYLYVGTSDFVRDLAYWRDRVGAEVVWSLEKFGARVAALRVGAGVPFLLADHRPAGSCMPIWEVEDLRTSMKTLVAHGWKPRGGPFDVPDGPCCRFDDPSGNAFAILQMDRPDALGGNLHAAPGAPARADARPSRRRRSR